MSNNLDKRCLLAKTLEWGRDGASSSNYTRTSSPTSSSRQLAGNPLIFCQRSYLPPA
ncbi:unnamed protein product [Lupinus luteus]|uniref:Uncharacterized protein n=1 Tax=Lupinus luteus TaxID=3873 RepID=A0AAV1XNY4_LUPLU